MIIVSEQKQNVNGLSSNEIALIKSIRLSSQVKVPKGTNFGNAKQFSLRYMFVVGTFQHFERYLRIHHKKFNNNHSISILLRVKSYLSIDNSITAFNCLSFNDDYSEIKFALKEGMYQGYTVYDDIASADRFLNRKDYYQKLINSIEEELFKIF